MVTPVDPTKAGSVFEGWSTTSGNLFNFKSIINGNVSLTARWRLYPQYIALSSGDGQYNASIIRNNFGAAQGKNIVVATQPLFRVFERDVNTVLVPSIRRHLAEAEQYDVPIMIFLGVMPFNKVRPDLFNWWDQQAPDPTGKRITNKNNYNPANVNNVEWTGWDASTAVKIGWLIWGTKDDPKNPGQKIPSQQTLEPMPNLMCADFQAAERAAIVTLMTIVNDWYDKLPLNKKYLFAGIRSTDEMAFGINNFYYPNGNSYLGLSESLVPTTGVDPLILPSRGVQTIGYNAVKTAGIKSSGELTIEDLNEVCRRHGEFLSKIYFDLGFPREKIFASSFGKTVGECKTCFNKYACPSWSFYQSEAVNPLTFTAALTALKDSDAPEWAMAEWGIPKETTDPNKWATALNSCLLLPGNRLIRITGNIVIEHGGKINPPAVEGINMILK